MEVGTEGMGQAWGKPLCYPWGLHHALTESHNPIWKREDWAVLCRHPEAHRVSTHSEPRGLGLEGKPGVGFDLMQLVPSADGPYSNRDWGNAGF